MKFFSFIFCFLIFFSLQSYASGRMVYGESARVDSFNPYLNPDNVTSHLSDLLFDSLVEISHKGEYAPGLAKSWTIAGDHTKIQFNLRQDVFWHGKDENNLKKFTSQDVVSTLHLLLNSDFPNKERFSFISDAKMLNAYQVEITFRQVVQDPLKSLTFKILPHLSFASKKNLNRTDSFNQNPIGTGPYQFSKLTPQGEVLLVANSKYFKGPPPISEIVMKPFSNQGVMSQSLLFKALDLVTYVSPRDIPSLQGDRDLRIVPYDALSYSFIAMNQSHPLLRDKNIRKALSLAINRKEMLSSFYQNHGILISGPFAPSSWAYNSEIKPLPYDPKESKVLLKTAGLHENSQGKFLTANNELVSLKMLVPIGGENETIKKVVLTYQHYLEQVGIKLELTFLDWINWKEKVLGQHQYDLTIASWSFDDASNIRSLFHSSEAKAWGNNFVLLKNNTIDSLLVEAQVTNDFDKRRAIYQKLHTLLAEEVPYTFLWTLEHHAAHWKKVSGVTIDPSGFFKYIVTWNMGEKNTL